MHPQLPFELEQTPPPYPSQKAPPAPPVPPVNTEFYFGPSVFRISLLNTWAVCSWSCSVAGSDADNGGFSALPCHNFFFSASTCNIYRFFFFFFKLPWRRLVLVQVVWFCSVPPACVRRSFSPSVTPPPPPRSLCPHRRSETYSLPVWYVCKPQTDTHTHTRTGRGARVFFLFFF